MKRLHVHVSVDDLAVSTRFYSALFAQDPSVSKPDYAKWEVDDPRVNFSISAKRDNVPGLNHLGIQAGTTVELDDLYGRLENASVAMLEERGARCCYAESDKHWATDPDGVVWEMFQTMGAATTYGEDRGLKVGVPLSEVQGAPQPVNADTATSVSGCCP